MAVMKARYSLLDFIRGICILLVVGYHILYDLSEIFGGHYAFFRSEGMVWFRHCFVGTLILISGISCSLTRSNFKRGIKTLLIGCGITLFTWICMPDMLITFGILHFFGCSMLLYALFQKALTKIPGALGFCLSLLALVLTWNIYEGQLGFFALPDMPRSFPLFILGFRAGFFSSDYYPMMPWFFLFLSGSFLGPYFKKGTVPAVFKKDPLPFISKLGRHTLAIYIIHQPIVYGVLYLYFVLL